MGATVYMKKKPKLSVVAGEDGVTVSFAAEEINMSMCADTETEALDAFWDYVFDLIPVLEKEAEAGRLAKHLMQELEFLREHFVYLRDREDVR